MAELATSIIVPVGLPPFRDGLREHIEDDGFEVKKEFHLTVASSEYRQGLSPEQLEHFEDLLGSKPLQIIYEDTLYRIAKPKQLPDATYERQSVVALVKPDVIFRRIGEIAAQLDFIAPDLFPHVTIATSTDNIYARRGISISSAEEWSSLAAAPFFEGWIK